MSLASCEHRAPLRKSAPRTACPRSLPPTPCSRLSAFWRPCFPPVRAAPGTPPGQGGRRCHRGAGPLPPSLPSGSLCNLPGHGRGGRTVRPVMRTLLALCSCRARPRCERLSPCVSPKFVLRTRPRCERLSPCVSPKFVLRKGYPAAPGRVAVHGRALRTGHRRRPHACAPRHRARALTRGRVL